MAQAPILIELIVLSLSFMLLDFPKVYSACYSSIYSTIVSQFPKSCLDNILYILFRFSAKVHALTNLT